MNRQDQKAIEDLFARLAEVGETSGPRDAEAEAYIGERIVSQPTAPYYMAQTIVVQNQALEAAGKRIAELEGKGEADSGLFSGLFGGGRARGSVPRAGRRAPAYEPGGGFLAGAAQTAMGVAGGVLLGNMLAGAFFGSPASAGEAAQSGDNADGTDADAPATDTPDTGGFDSGDFDVGGDF